MHGLDIFRQGRLSYALNSFSQSLLCTFSVRGSVIIQSLSPVKLRHKRLILAIVMLILSFEDAKNWALYKKRLASCRIRSCLHFGPYPSFNEISSNLI